MLEGAEARCPVRVLFIGPAFPGEMQDFTRGLAEVGAEVVGVGEGPLAGQPAKVRSHLRGWIQIPRLLDEEDAARRILAELGEWRPDRVEALWEPTVLLAARLRDALGIGGMSRDTVLGFRDKELMKERLRAGGVRVPRSARVRSATEAREAAAEIGFPVVMKPIAGAGSADTWCCADLASLDAALEASGHVEEVSVEEYVEGDELTWDAIALDGEPVFESVTQYFPKPIISRNEEWVSPAQVTWKDPFAPELAPGGVLGRAALSALGMQRGFVHMEWYRTATGEAVLGEIACRSGGGHLMDQLNWANDMDAYREWARVVCWGAFEGRPSRQYHCGVVFKRAQGQGIVRRIEGLEALRREIGPAFLGHSLTPVGARRRSWKDSLIGDGAIAFRHEERAVVEAIVDRVVNGLRLFAS